MKKSRAVVTLLLTVVLTGLLLFTSAAGWGADGLGSADKIHLGLDLAGGVSITTSSRCGLLTSADAIAVVMAIATAIKPTKSFILLVSTFEASFSVTFDFSSLLLSNLLSIID